MKYNYYSKKYYSTVCHILEFNPKEFRLDVSLGVYGKLETLPKITGEPKKDEKVIAKMNASFFSMNSNSDTYSTFVDEGLYYHPSAPGYPTLVFWKDYTMTVENDPTPERLVYYQHNAFFAIGIGWTLIINGKVDYTYSRTKLTQLFSHPFTRQPRTMIGQKSDGTIVMVVTDGRSTGSSGLTTDHMSDIMMKFGCKIAVNMDGGGSSELNIDGKTINKLQNGAHRKIGTAFIVYGPKENSQVIIKEPDVTYSTEKAGSTTASSLTVRSGAGTSYDKLGFLSNGTNITILGENSTGKWYYIKTDSINAGWVSASYVKVVASAAAKKVSKKATGNLHIRDKRNKNGNSLGIIPKGTSVIVSDLKSGWYKVEYNGITGYSSATYLK